MVDETNVEARQALAQTRLCSDCSGYLYYIFWPCGSVDLMTLESVKVRAAISASPSSNHYSTQFPSTCWSVPFGVSRARILRVLTPPDAREGARNSR